MKNHFNHAGVKYRLRCILKQQYYEGTFDSIAELLAEFGELLNINRSKADRIRSKACWHSGKYSHVIIDDIPPTDMCMLDST
jgi:hypothetical protein